MAGAGGWRYERNYEFFYNANVYVRLNLHPSYISVGMWTAVVLYETSRLKSGSISKSSGTYRFFFLFASSVWLSCTKREKTPSFKSILQSIFWIKRGLCVCVPLVCKHTVYAVSCDCDWQGVNVEYSLQCQYWQIKTEKLNFRQWNINPGTQRERETWERGCHSNTEWH